MKKENKKKLVKNTKFSLRKKKKESDSIVVNNTKIYQKMKNLLGIERNIIK